jgi:hypothetical protein
VENYRDSPDFLTLGYRKKPHLHLYTPHGVLWTAIAKRCSGDSGATRLLLVGLHRPNRLICSATTSANGGTVSPPRHERQWIPSDRVDTNQDFNRLPFPNRASVVAAGAVAAAAG